MKCPHCGQEHSDKSIKCRSTGKMLKRACFNEVCSYYGEYLFPLEQETCPCCGMSLIDTNNGHKFVDLGLSVKWATCNIGANNPEESGDCFFWGEKAPHDLSPRTNTFEKYYSKRQGTLEIIDDAAHENWGGSWRMPTKEDFEELIDPNNCDIEFTSLNSVPVYKIISKKIGYEDCFIFFPLWHFLFSNFTADLRFALGGDAYFPKSGAFTFPISAESLFSEICGNKVTAYSFALSGDSLRKKIVSLPRARQRR